MQNTTVVDRRPMFRGLAGIDVLFVLALGVMGLAAYLAIKLR